MWGLKEQNATFWLADNQAYSEAWGKLKSGIRNAKHKYKKHIEDNFTNNNSCSMWNGIKALTGYKTTKLPSSDDTKLPDVLNQLCARFATQSRGTTLPIISPPEETTLVLQHH